MTDSITFPKNQWPSPVPPEQKSLADSLQEEIYSTDLEVENVKRKVEHAQELAEQKLTLLYRRKFALERSLAREREQGAGFRQVNHNTGEILTPEVRP